MIVTRIRPVVGWGDMFGDLDRMRRDMDRLVRAAMGPGYEEPGTGLFPAMNVTQDADNLYVRAELPGLAATDFEVSTVGQRLTISGKRELPVEKEDVSYHRREREGGAFSRSIDLPGGFDAEKVEAQYNNGVLTVVLPRPAAAKPRQITVKTS